LGGEKNKLIQRWNRMWNEKIITYTSSSEEYVPTVWLCYASNTLQLRGYAESLISGTPALHKLKLQKVHLFPACLAGAARQEIRTLI
jgi:hypothetical protein